MNKILVVGLGSIGVRHVNNLLENFKDIKIIICTKRKEIPKEIKNNKKICIFKSLNECIKQNPNIAFITNESAYHIPTALKLAKEKIDLFIEKPLSNSMINVEKLENIIQQNKIVAHIGYNFRFFPPMKKIKQMIDRKTIGRIISAQIENNSFLPDYHPWENYRKSYAAKKELGGGVVLTQIHDIDFIRWLFGDVKRIISITGKFSNLEISSEDMSASLIEFKNNVICQMNLSFFQRPYYRSCKIKGTKGVIEWNSDNNSVRLFLGNTKKWKNIKIRNNYKLISSGSTSTITNKRLNQMYIDEIKYFINCVNKRNIKNNNIQDGIETLKLAIKIKSFEKK